MEESIYVMRIIIIILFNAVIGIYILKLSKRYWEWVLKAPSIWLTIIAIQLWFVIYLVAFYFFIIEKTKLLLVKEDTKETKRKKFKVRIKYWG